MQASNSPAFAKNIFAFGIVGFFVFPKVPIFGTAGITGGELTLYLAALLMLAAWPVRFSRSRIVVIAGFLCFIFFYVFFSYFVNLLLVGDSGVKTPVNFIRIISYLAIIFLTCAAALRSQDDAYFYDIFRNAFVIHGAVAIAYFFWAFLTVQPSIGDILGSVNPGARLSPIYGMTLSTTGSLPMVMVGGGAGNLLGSHALAVLVAARFFERSARVEIFLFVLGIFLMLLGQSRGGLMTILLWGSYRVFNAKNREVMNSRNLIFIIGISLASAFFIWVYSEQLALFKRFADILESRELDGSILARFKNYSDVLAVWCTSPWFILFGLGLDEGAMEARTGWTLVESLYLAIIFSGGLVSLVFFLLFFYFVFKIKRECLWYQALFMFLFFNSIVNWSVTGGDLTGPPALFTVFYFLGVASRAAFDPIAIQR